MARHAWLITAAKQVRRWREEDRANGIIWADEQPARVEDRAIQGRRGSNVPPCE